MLFRQMYVGSRVIGAGPALLRYSYDASSGAWNSVSIASLPTITALTQMDILGGYLYALGTDNANAPSTMLMQKYDPSADTWTAAASTPTARQHTPFGLIACSGYLYACGGYHSSSRLDSCERYDPAADAWTSRASMLGPRADFGAAVINGNIYVAGGITGDGWAAHTSSVERYDPTSDTWTAVASMSSARAYVDAAALGGHLYTCGGYSTSSAAGLLESCERYDAAADSWSSIASTGISGALYTMAVASLPA